jgi:hypothetical protein
MHAFVYQLGTQQTCDVVRQDVDEANADVIPSTPGRETSEVVCELVWSDSRSKETRRVV